MKTPYTFNSQDNPHEEIGAIEKTLFAHIRWAVNNKDRKTLFSTIAESRELFFFQPDSQSTIRGIGEFNTLVEEFMQDDFVALRNEIRDLRIHLSPSLQTAWFSCLLDDYNEYQGKPFVWKDVRWTGVLEKIGDEWKIFQMHFSKAEDQVH